MQRNLNKLNEDLAEIQNIVTRNIQDVLGQGEKLDRAPPMRPHCRCPLCSGRVAASACHPGPLRGRRRRLGVVLSSAAAAAADVSAMSTTLTQESRRYANRAKDLSRRGGRGGQSGRTACVCPGAHAVVALYRAGHPS